MRMSSDRQPLSVVQGALVLTCMLGSLAEPARAEGIRAQAIVNLSFDEPAGDALDSATAGAAKDNGALVGSPGRIFSPFPGQSGKQALVLDAGTKQSVRVNDSPDLDRPEAVSVSLFFVNLHPTNDAAFHGVFAKRDPAGTNVTNYGINFAPRNDLFQVYVNDGTGFKSATFGMQAAAPYRKPVFLTATYQTGDAPAPDADEDPDDVRVRLFVNGKPVTPKGASGGVVAGDEVWLTDVKIAGLVNDVPLTLGSSTTSLEHTTCLLDEFSLFSKALSPEDAAALYAEVAGADAATAIADEGQAAPAGPEIAGLSLRGLQSGQTTVLAVTGTNLQPAPQLVLPFATERTTLRPGGTAERLEFEIALPAAAPTGHYPLRVRTSRGISGGLTLAVDPLPQIPYAEGAPDKPVELPVAISGELSGQQQHRLYFAGKAGQRVVIDLECKRLGSAMDPVLELRNPRGAPLHIAWGRPQYRGDTRIESVLFADGIYSIDLHDLAYKAPGQNAYRLKIGDLKIIDTTFPPAVAPGASRTVAAIGPGMDSAATVPVEMPDELPGVTQPINMPPTTGVVGPVPALVVSETTEVLEAAQPEGQLQSIDARFLERQHVPLFVDGRISRPGETDRYLLQVTPGMKLSLSAESHALRSPLDARLLIVSPTDASVLAASEEKPAVEYAVPAGVTAIELDVRDLNRRGGAEFVYRLRIIPTGQPDFSISADLERLALARDGSAVLRVDVNRSGYNGPIALSLEGASELSIVPAEIPAGASKAFVQVISRSPEGDPEAIVRRVRMFGQSTGLEPPLRRPALTPFDSRLSLVPAERARFTVALAPALGTSLEPGGTPPAALFKGTETTLPLLLKTTSPHPSARAVRLTLVTTEAPRTAVDPTDPARQRRVPLALVRSLPEQTVPVGEPAAALRIAVPLDVAEPQLDCIIRADFIPHPFSDKVQATLYSAPIRLNVQNAATVQLAANALTVSSKAETRFAGTLKRAAGFTEPVEVSLVNLPAGYMAPKVTLPSDQEQFEIVVTAPEIAAAADIPNVQFRVTSTAGSLLLADMPVATKATPGQ